MKDDMAAIEELTRDYSAARDRLVTALGELEADLTRLKSRRLRKIKHLVAEVDRSREDLAVKLTTSPELFAKRRTRIFHRVRVGWEKRPGKVTWQDEALVVRLIRKCFPEQVKTLLKETAKPVKKALQGLSVKELKRIGVAVAETGERIVIRPAASEMEKTVEALLAAHRAEKAEGDDAP